MRCVGAARGGPEWAKRPKRQSGTGRSAGRRPTVAVAIAVEELLQPGDLDDPGGDPGRRLDPERRPGVSRLLPDLDETGESGAVDEQDVGEVDDDGDGSGRQRRVGGVDEVGHREDVDLTAQVERHSTTVPNRFAAILGQPTRPWVPRARLMVSTPPDRSRV